MPLPTPNATETKAQFIDRFMRSAEARREYQDIEQRRAVAETKWRNRNI